MKKYVIGIDYGTLSARGVLVDTENGAELAEASFAYPHAVMDKALPSGAPLPELFALQHPKDYLDALAYIPKKLLSDSGVSNTDVCGIGIDFTACTVLPVDKEGTPLSMKEEFSDNPHAYVKLWKHHSAQPEADEINALAESMGEEWLKIYGGKISCEWMLPKVLETLRKSEDVYNAADRFYEAADWLSLVLTGEESHSAAFAGYKALWNAESGYPSNEFYKRLDARLDGIVGTKISEKVFGMDKSAGKICESGAALTGLAVGTTVALPMIDAHAAMPALGICEAGELMIILGTSACHIFNESRGVLVEGTCGYVKDGVIPGLYTYEAGQPAVGDIFDWFVKNGVPASYEKEAEERGVNIHTLLSEKAKELKITDRSPVALDWHNGNRSILVNSSLMGVVSGLTLATKPEELYRAYLEATAFGLKVIIEQYESCGLSVDRICASGGIAMKNTFMMQLYADILGKRVEVSPARQAGALGSAVYAATAAGIYPSVSDAARVLSKPASISYEPSKENESVYKKLYDRYRKLYEFFGKTLEM